MMLDWLIIGGGGSPRGTHLSLVLLERLGVKRHALRVLDPHEQPLARWPNWNSVLSPEIFPVPVTPARGYSASSAIEIILFYLITARLSL
ncbi:MAG: hypothetical protein FVQ81_07090 [Candidatus Glassbacteria bacterium]|nr:hypothetical protein [Candidatus Glassbacteria bacterium]